MNQTYHGIYAALVTPYTESGEVDCDELQKLVRSLIDRGIDGFYVGGSTAEAFLLTENERKKVLEAVVEANGGERKVICHVGAISTDMAVDYARHAERAGADAVSAISPFYYKFLRGALPAAQVRSQGPAAAEDARAGDCGAQAGGLGF